MKSKSQDNWKISLKDGIIRLLEEAQKNAFKEWIISYEWKETLETIQKILKQYDHIYDNTRISENLPDILAWEDFSSLNFYDENLTIQQPKDNTQSTNPENNYTIQEEIPYWNLNSENSDSTNINSDTQGIENKQERTIKDFFSELEYKTQIKTNHIIRNLRNFFKPIIDNEKEKKGFSKHISVIFWKTSFGILVIPVMFVGSILKEFFWAISNNPLREKTETNNKHIFENKNESISKNFARTLFPWSIKLKEDKNFKSLISGKWNEYFMLESKQNPSEKIIFFGEWFDDEIINEVLFSYDAMIKYLKNEWKEEFLINEDYIKHLIDKWKKKKLKELTNYFPGIYTTEGDFLYQQKSNQKTLQKAYYWLSMSSCDDTYKPCLIVTQQKKQEPEYEIKYIHKNNCISVRCFNYNQENNQNTNIDQIQAKK